MPPHGGAALTLRRQARPAAQGLGPALRCAAAMHLPIRCLFSEGPALHLCRPPNCRWARLQRRSIVEKGFQAVFDYLAAQAWMVNGTIACNSSASSATGLGSSASSSAQITVNQRLPY